MKYIYLFALILFLCNCNEIDRKEKNLNLTNEVIAKNKLKEIIAGDISWHKPIVEELVFDSTSNNENVIKFFKLIPSYIFLIKINLKDTNQMTYNIITDSFKKYETVDIDSTNKEKIKKIIASFSKEEFFYKTNNTCIDSAYDTGSNMLYVNRVNEKYHFFKFKSSSSRGKDDNFFKLITIFWDVYLKYLEDRDSINKKS